MSRMSEISIEIQDLINEGELSFQDIARKLQVPQDWVELEYEQMMERDYDDSMDGDAASALASAGWGTDEDYGSYGDDY